MSKINKSISDALGINDDKVIDMEMEPVEEEKCSTDLTIVEHSNTSNGIDTSEHIKQDYALSRDTFHGIIRIGSKAIEDLAQMAQESESNKSYEVLATLITSISSATKDLYDLQKKTKELYVGDEKKRIDETNINVEKAVFVGTTADLLRQIKAEEKQKSEE